MAQIKVLDLCDSNSLSELSNEDAKKVNGGTALGAGGFLTGYASSRIGGLSRSRSAWIGLYSGVFSGLAGFASGPIAPLTASLSS